MQPRIKEYQWIVKKKWTSECMEELRRRSQKHQREVKKSLHMYGEMYNILRPGDLLPGFSRHCEPTRFERSQTDERCAVGIRRILMCKFPCCRLLCDIRCDKAWRI